VDPSPPLFAKNFFLSDAAGEHQYQTRSPKTKLELLVGGACPALQLIEQDMCEDLIVFNGEWPSRAFGGSGAGASGIGACASADFAAIRPKTNASIKIAGTDPIRWRIFPGVFMTPPPF
jgi:hypothetical protein